MKFNVTDLIKWVFLHIYAAGKHERTFCVVLCSNLEGPQKAFHQHKATHLPTVALWYKAFGSTSYLVINVKRPLSIIDIG